MHALVHAFIHSQCKLPETECQITYEAALLSLLSFRGISSSVEFNPHLLSM